MIASIPTVSGFYNPSRTYGNYTSGSAVRADMAYNQTSDIVIHTLEGDTVTLSSSMDTTGSYDTYEALAVGKDGFAYRYGETAHFESRRQLSIAVTGDLNREELEDIDSILGTLDEIMKDLSAGDLGRALSKSSAFTGIDAIASFSADLNITATLSASRLETASAASSAPGPWNKKNNAITQIDQMADKISSALKNRTALLEYLVPEIDDSFSIWSDTASIQSNDQSEGMKWARHFAQRLTDELNPGMLNNNDSSAAYPPLS
jgi:hypothetical protein